ncbi:MAG: hypothetical protein ACEQSB_01260, partial [Undibacterium sp.]
MRLGGGQDGELDAETQLEANFTLRGAAAEHARIADRAGDALVEGIASGDELVVVLGVDGDGHQRARLQCDAGTMLHLDALGEDAFDRHDLVAERLGDDPGNRPGDMSLVVRDLAEGFDEDANAVSHDDLLSGWMLTEPSGSFGP